ncbi:hypothetical protein OFR29_02065 [Brachyspira hyodysenteriae]|uniref:hypothetical protein n=1 Tax=Brachyspira hyodysenteriae TaxID=159 RepID=UPI0022CD56FD|nr:hypothetical protein [Brachyspira hyodysenteriae]MCZ9878384.1 hypothetical protein [Brachyspira hyodysenteriae]MCZ9891112.1 hypothetical protein [Brachyspira hyodysenteriae]MCZ9898014.1 hypothetical protein [Brachyspira hyodysenteriae]MCZ9988360.1 hypothetical protein [Brachyspira hyodysenteriae]MCZ9997017.1 hypothetical protein [Brachyspira hyodysenteriae]
MFKSYKTIFVSFLFMLLSQTSYAEIGGFEIISNVPIGAGITLYNPASKEFKSSGNFQIGIEADIGYMFNIKENMGFSLLGSLGYGFTGFNYSKGSDMNFKSSVHDLYIGFYPKFNIQGFSIGINTGVKFDVGSYSVLKYYDSESKLENKIQPRTYIKGTFDYSIFFNETMALNIGLYIGYDWGFKWDKVIESSGISSGDSYGNLDIGLQIGYRFGPKFSKYIF